MSQLPTYPSLVTGRFSSKVPQIVEVPRLLALVRCGDELFQLKPGAEDILGAALNGELGEKAEMTGLSVVASFWTVHPAGYPPSFKPQRRDVLAQLAEGFAQQDDLFTTARAYELVPDTVQLIRKAGTADYCHHVQVRIYGRV
jgi:hypothetical protein